ncbi:MAG TPA: class I SAM-dependent methyltransferase [Vicinamibacterales bacterium]|nr:class I SAM-dependent methyltransferase [Vicinamibacterales bacterium]
MDSPWRTPATVAGFTASPPNETLIRFAAREMFRLEHPWAVDIGCGAARNAVPLAEGGWTVVGIDDSMPMLTAAAERARKAGVAERCLVALATMDALPMRSGLADLIIAHGIWNLARSAAEFRRAVREAARVAKPGAALFVFTFSRTTLPPEAQPVAGEPFVFTQFSGQPQCFLTGAQLVAELSEGGFDPDPGVPLRELNVPPPGTRRMGGPPIIYEGTFRRRPE